MKTDQLIAAGLTRNGICQRAKRGLLHRRCHGVYAVGHPALSREGEMLAAVLAAGPGAVLSHDAAAELWQIRRYRAAVLAVLSPRRRALAGVKVRTCRRLDARDVTIHRGIPVTTVVRTLVDLTDILDADEETFRALTRRAGLPQPRRNVHVEGFEVDCFWPDRALIAEVDGAGHERPSAKREDALRDRLLAAAGYTVVRFTDFEIERCPEAVLARLRAYV